jgi:hypothetical protein
VALLLTDLEAGHSFETIQFVIDRERSQAYLDATGDKLTLYNENYAVPPLAVAALALGALLERVSLPPGTLHASESLRAYEAVQVGTRLQCDVRLAQRSARGGWIVSVLESEILVEGRVAVSTRATVLSPADPA